MNFQKLFQMQKELDFHIQCNHNLQDQNLRDKKILALLVEIGELANETRCFKFWSLKDPAPKEKILEEYVDGIHFLLSLGLECGYENNQFDINSSKMNELTEQFLKVFDCVSVFKVTSTIEHYKSLFLEYLKLGELLGFSSSEVEQAYIQKNEVNYERQEKGY